MSTAATVDELSFPNTKTVQWAALANGETGTFVSMPNIREASVQFAGTFGTSGSVKLQGSNDGTNFVDLKDKLGNSVVATAGAIFSLEAVPLYIQPVCTAGDGTTALKITAFATKAR